MAEVKWIKIVTDIFDDEKVLLIESMPEADAIIVIWFKMLCLAGKQNNSGVFQLHGRIAYTDEMFATIFRRPVNTVRLALRTFEQFGMIEIVNDTVTIPNWEKHQKIDALEASREATKHRVARYREKQKQLAGDCNVTGNVTVTPCNADRIDKNREDSIDDDDDIKRGRAREDDNPFGDGSGPVPTLTTVQRYALDNLRTMTPGNMQEFNEFLTEHGVSEELMMYAIDIACGNGSPVWNYAARILYRWLDAGIRSVADAKADREKHRRKSARDGPQQETVGIDRRNNRVPERYGGGEVI